MVAKKSGNPANKAASGRTTPKQVAAAPQGVTSAAEWKKSSAGHELALPSGKVCLVKRPGIEMFAQTGTIPNGLMATIMPLIEDAQEKGRKGSKEASIDDEALEVLKDTMLQDPQKIADMVIMIDAITVQCVLQPKVHPVPQRIVEVDGAMVAQDVPAHERDQDLLFVDEVDFFDKQFIFNFAVGGSDDLDRFREGALSAVAD